MPHFINHFRTLSCLKLHVVSKRFDYKLYPCTLCTGVDHMEMHEGPLLRTIFPEDYTFQFSLTLFSKLENHHSEYSNLDVDDFIIVKIFGCWCSTPMLKDIVTDILQLSSTNSAPLSRHQHRCSPAHI